MDGLEVVATIMAAWLLLVAVGYWAHRQALGLTKDMLIASVRAPLQLLLLAFVLHWLFDIQSYWAQAGIILGFCILAGYTSAGYHYRFGHAWLSSSFGLAVACLVTLPWLIFVQAFEDNARTLIPLGSMVAANGMNAISIMFERVKPVEGVAVTTVKEGLRTAMISPINTLKVVGLVHMPGIFVGMILAGSTVFAAASAQLVVLYMIVASSFTACVVSFLMMQHLHKGVVEVKNEQ
ncbi:ABC transporter permease [Ghiorsea bivora]|uniref:ABC transporter permease n=1 Tax=Ghiorsea bivora TaxID=1485545 RepID=UPI00056DCA62|nr:ABC transporter permease [Ghiorsea bivora]